MTQPLMDETRSQMICLLGTNGAGKTSSLKVLKTNELGHTKRTPIVNFQSHTWSSLANEPNHLRIWDCSGFTQISKLTGLHVKRSRGALIFYNCHLRSTFDDLDIWIDLALSRQISKENIWIVRTQFENKDEEEIRSMMVDQTQGKRFAEKRGIQHVILEDYRHENVRSLYQSFGNKIINQNLNQYWSKQLIRRSFSNVMKEETTETKSDTFLYVAIGSMLLGYLAYSYSRAPPIQ